MTLMKDTPNIHSIDAMHQPLTGAGEPGVLVIAPAICDVIFNATGERGGSLPLVNLGIV